MKGACIDIGSNSILLSIAEPSARGWIKEVCADRSTTRLGKNLQKTGRLSSDAIKKSIAAVERMVKLAQKENCTKIFIVGTQALRKAQNSKRLAESIKLKTGLNVKIISGREEARLAHFAVSKSLPKAKSRIIADIGGGSTEIVVDKENRKIQKISIPIGCVTLRDNFRYPGQKEQLNNNINMVFLKNLKPETPGSLKIVLLGGTATALAAINLKLKKYDAQKVHGSKLTYKWTSKFEARFSKMDYNTKKRLIGASPRRIPVLGHGTMIVLALLDFFSKDHATISDAGLRHAVLGEYFIKSRR